ncbi:unnamed protein product [Rotaria sp. Silwood1]|nr:unnamed protein product [Rotaria sp. Silwood1]CAF1471131.1 unnamed protein product [Rotaria sp. Silwood1]
MNNTDQASFYSNPAASHPQIPGFYISNNRIEQPSPVQVWNQAPYELRMNHQPYINQQMSEDYPQRFHVPPTLFISANNLRPMNSSTVSLLQPSHANVNYSHLISQNEYSLMYAPRNNSLPSVSTGYSQPLFPTYPTSPVPSTIPNQPKTLQKPPDTLSDLTEQIQIHRIQDTKIDESTVAAYQPTIAQHIQQSNFCAPIISSRRKKRRKKKSLFPVDSVLHKPVEVSTQSITSATTISAGSSTIIMSENRPIESTTTNTVKSTNKTKKQAKVPQQYADILANSSNIQINKSDNPISSVTEEISKNLLKSQQTLIINDEKSLVSPKKRFHYDRQELLRIRDSSAPFPVPQRLVGLDIVVNQCDKNNSNDNTSHSYTDTTSQRRKNRACRQKSLRTNRKSLTHDQNNPSLTSGSSHKIEIHVSTEPDFSNQVTNTYIPVDQHKIDADNRFLCDVRFILNKLTPQTYDQLQKQLATLEIDSYEKLQGMVMILHSKAVDEPQYGFLYAKLCRQFRKVYFLLSI